MIDSSRQVDELLGALEAALALETAETYELLICGGAALMATGLVRRTTMDVDVLALIEVGADVLAKPLPEPIRAALRRVAEAHGLDEDWLNDGPADMQRFGLPEGILERAHAKVYGPRLRARFAARYDQIHLKLFALVDQGGGKHLQDFRALGPTSDEVLPAARWTITQDPSPGFRIVLEDALRQLGFEDVVDRLP